MGFRDMLRNVMRYVRNIKCMIITSLPGVWGAVHSKDKLCAPSSICRQHAYLQRNTMTTVY